MTRRNRLLGVVFGGVIAATGLPAEAKTPADQLVIALNMSSMRGLDPQELNQLESAEVVANLYDRLLTLPADKPTDIKPGLAESWTVGPDGKTFTFKIRSGVTFHSGNKLTARDAEWTLRRLVKMGLAPARDIGQWGFTPANVDTLIRSADDSTLVVETPEVWSPDLVLYSLASFATSIVDSDLVAKNEQNGDFGRGYLQTHDAGTGPFILRSWRANDVLFCDAFKDYWGGAPAMRRILLRHIPESSAQRLQLENDDIDIATRLSASDLSKLGDSSDIRIEKTPGVGFYYIALNQQDPDLAKPQVREAFRYLIDYQGLANTVMKHYGVVQQTVVPFGMPGALPDNPYKLDIEKAKRLLAEAGYPNGFTKTYYATPVTPEFEIAQSFQANAARAGITLDLQPGDHIGDFRNRTYQIFSARTGDRMPDAYAVLQSYALNPDNRKEANLNGLMAWRAAWAVPQAIQDLVTRAAHELSSTKRAELYTEANRLYLQSNPPLITSFMRLDARAVRREVQGYMGHLTWLTRWDTVTKQK